MLLAAVAKQIEAGDFSVHVEQRNEPMKRRMGTPPEVSSGDDDDDDMFIRNSGASAAVSIYASEPAAGDDDDDDDDLSTAALPVVPAKRRRRRRGRLHHARPAPAQVIDLDGDGSDDATLRPSSVFTTIRDDDVAVVDVDSFAAVEDDAVTSAAARTQLQAQLALASAKQHLRGAPLEERLAEEAAREAHIEAARAEASASAERREREKAAARERAAREAATEASLSAARAAKAGANPAAAEPVAAGPVVTLRLRCGNNSVRVKLPRADPLRKMLPPFCARFNLDMAKAIMEVDGEEVEKEDTADTHDLDDDFLVDIRVRG